MRDPTKRLGHRLRLAARTYRGGVSIFVLAVGALLTILAVGAFTPLALLPPFPLVNSATDTSVWNFSLVFVIVGPIVTIVGAYMVGAYFTARRKFEHLLRTKSKAEFLRSIPDLEDLLWDLTPRDEARYDEKCRELHVQRPV